MSLFSKIKNWFAHKEVQQQNAVNEPNTLVEIPTVLDEEMAEGEAINLSEEEQQKLQIKQFIASDDMSNHELAAMFMLGLGFEWTTEMVDLVSKSAEKMIFWVSQEENQGFVKHFTKLVISPRFFEQYSEIALFAEVLPKFEYVEELHWQAKHYWNQHPILMVANQLPRLKRLYVQDCKMNFLPESICEAKNLEELYLSNNKLTEMPQDLEQLSHLKILDLSNNDFKKCPRSICALKKLEVLRLQNNPLLDLEPRMLGRLYKLKDLELPSEIAKKNLQTFKDWLPDVNFDKPYWK